MIWDWLFGWFEGLAGGAVGALPSGGLGVDPNSVQSAAASIAAAEAYIPIRGPIAIVVAYVGCIAAWALFRVVLLIWRLIRG